jgi:glycosyltransferase involved in cell wall biosynthesis
MATGMSQPQRVAILATDPSRGGGWSRYGHDLAAALLDLGLEVVMITAHDANPVPTLPYSGYHRVLPSLTPPERNGAVKMLRQWPALRKITAGADVIHATAEPYALACLGLGKRLVITAHGSYVPLLTKRKLLGRLYRHLFGAAQIVCVSDYTQQKVLAVLGRSARSQVVFSGVDSAKFATLPPLPTETVKTGPTILAVGQLKPRKGFHLLVQAMPQVRAVIPNAQAIFIGDTSANPAYVAGLRQTVAALRLSEAVHFLGLTPEPLLLAWFGAADVFTLPSLNDGPVFEGFGLVYLEAAAAGLPTIGPRDCGAESAIRHGETGLLVPQNNVPALAEAVITLLGNPAQRAAMGAAGQAFAREQTWAQTAQQMAAIYGGAS